MVAMVADVEQNTITHIHSVVHRVRFIANDPRARVSMCVCLSLFVCNIKQTVQTHLTRGQAPLCYPNGSM